MENALWEFGLELFINLAWCLGMLFVVFCFGGKRWRQDERRKLAGELTRYQRVLWSQIARPTSKKPPIPIKISPLFVRKTGK